ncbi:hypothetical protein KAT92_05130 [Candidatus Babeliales bacterium]|nr:hypothetical protein [Candidatus Babeliales bacterium]
MTAFVTGSTPFGIFDADVCFQDDASKIEDWVRRKLGGSQLCVELSSSDIFSSFEEAAIEYSAYINQYQFKSVAADILGSSTGSLSASQAGGGQENRYPQSLLEFQKRQAEPYGEIAGVGGAYTLHSASFTTTAGIADYDIQDVISDQLTGSDGRVRRAQIKEIFHFSPLTQYRFFGTTSAVNYLNNQFSFESFTPETVFYMLPVWEDILRGMQFETSNRVRRSQYSYDNNNNVIKLYPPPSTDTRVHFTYWLPKGPYTPDYDDAQIDGVANVSNAPFSNILYCNLNSIARQWIWKMSFALSKEILGEMRSKMSTIPIPGGDLSLNGPELISDARVEADRLRNELREYLEETTYQAIAQKEADKADAIKKTIAEVPLGIYVGGLIPFLFWMEFLR